MYVLKIIRKNELYNYFLRFLKNCRVNNYKTDWEMFRKGLRILRIKKISSAINFFFNFSLNAVRGYFT